jgi:hypothetical protein
MPQNTNLDVSPYFDDFEEDKNYQKVLFKPGTPIQARELTTLQSILQNQIERFGQHFFKEGSMVIPGQIAYDPNYTSVSINDSHLGISVSTYIDKFVGKLIKGQTSGVVAKVESYISNTTSERSVYTLYVKYISSSNTNFTTSSFIDGENLISVENVDYEISAIRANSTFATTLSTNSTSIGSAAKIAEGIYFIRGFFVKINSQTIILDQYTNTPSYRVGLEIIEEIAVASNDYEDLFDNAQGFSNFAAPGADRLRIYAVLIKKDINDFNDENFIELLRVRSGIIEKFVENTNYNLIRDELARRTYDESGDYYIRPFGVSLKECLNDRIGNNGIFYPGEVTRQGNVATSDLACVSISPGKAYVRGYEVETKNLLLDIKKPRTTDRVTNENVQLSLGNQLIVNNVYGSIPVGFTTSSQVYFYDQRNSTPGKSNGTLIGISKVYDYEARSSEYVGPQTEYVVSLYDTQLFTKIKLNSIFTSLQVPTFIEGKHSGARGFLYSSVTNSDTLYLYDVSGVFNINEPIKIDGIDNNRLIIEIKDYKIGDVHQVIANEGISGVGTFSSDTLLSNRVFISDVDAPFTITASSGGISTVYSTSTSTFNNIEVNDVISYSRPGFTLPTYNRISSINSTSGFFTIVSTPNISGVSTGGLPSSQIVSNDLRKVETTILNPTSSNFYVPLKNSNVSNIDLTTTSATIKRSFDITVSTSSFTFVLDAPELSFEAFDEDSFTLTFKNSGTVIPLREFVNITFSSNRKEVTIQGLSQTGPALFTAACKINSITTRKKIFNRCASIIIDKSNSAASGIGSTTLNDGLTYSKVYGTRVQDKEISLGVPDVIKVLAIFESSSTNNPNIPKLVLENISTNILNAVKGEQILGSSSKAVGYFVGYLSSNEIEYVLANENKFIVGEEVVFQESGLIANITSLIKGDNNITNDFDLDGGYRNQYLDFSRILRKNSLNIPNKKIRIICNNYTIPNNDSGDIVTINSYDSDRYQSDLPRTSTFFASDFIDLRPAVSQYSGTFSPFESRSRNFSSTSNSSPHIFSKNTTINFSYEYYLPRIDKLFLFKDGNFVINEGKPALSPAIPQGLDNALEIATIKLPAYLRNVNEATLEFTQHKRYTMKDISRLEDRLSNIENYTLLSLLEIDTKNLIIRDDTTGLDRFKCGFFVDNFRDISGGDINSPDFKASLDIQNGLLRPSHYTTSLDLIPGTNRIIGFGNTTGQTVDLRYSLDLGSPNIKRVGDVVCLNYTDVEYISNPFATRVENVNPFNVINWVGTIELNPSSDDWVETRKLGDRSIGGFEGDYLEAITRLNADINTGLSPIEWGAWETTWTGVSATRNITSGGFIPGRGVPINTSTRTTTTQQQQRTGTQFQINERIDSISLGDKVISSSTVKFMRSRNIEVIARRLKPNTRLYAFFDNVNVTEFMIPKLIEVTMNSGTFIEGETVTGVLGPKQIRFRLAPQNHKYGPIDNTTSQNSPLPENYTVENYKNDIYRPENSISSIYSATSTTLNVDTASLEINGVSEFFGCISEGMRLVGNNSRAVATVSKLRLVSDKYGTFIGSFFIPDPISPSTPTFETGTKTFVLTTSEVNSSTYGFSDSSGIGNFTSSGILESVESNTLRIRNADVEVIERQDQRVLENIEETTVVRYTDPLAQSFLVEDENGIYLTKCDIFFKTKDSSNIPVTLQIRTVELGLPTQTILPFGEVTLNPESINISDDGTIATTFFFPSPVYLESGKQYSIVLLSASNEYTVWISRMGETEVTTLDLPESDRVIVSQQPLLGSLFKSQNGSTWDPSQYEDLKFKLYRAQFTSGEGTVRFYNPDLGIGNGQVATLKINPIFSYSRKVLAGVGKSLTTADKNLLVPGATITQETNNYFRADLVSVVGSIGIGSTLIVTQNSTGFGTTTTTFNNVKLISFTGIGQNARANISVISGSISTVTVVSGGTGYIQGDTLTVDTNDTNNLGGDLIITIPNNVGIITSFNSILLDNVQGDLFVDSTSDIIVNGTPLTSSPVSSTPTVLSDGLHLRISHPNHGMYDYQNYVTISGIESDIPPVKLTADLNSNATEISLSSVGIMTYFENIPVNSNNPGYIIINNEIIKYTGFNLGTNKLTGITRFSSSFFNSEDPLLSICYYSQLHSVGDDVYKYEFNGISLNRINTTHNLGLVDSEKYPLTLDSYHVKLNMNSSGNKDRSSSTGINPLYFNTKKFGGSFITDASQLNTVTGQKATQNILFSSIRPNIQSLLPPKTNITAKVRTVTGSSVDGNEVSFVDRGFEGVSLNSNNFFEEPRMICSKINENIYLGNLPGKKSFTMEINMSSTDRKVSPMIDLDRVNIITTTNRIDKPVLDYITDDRVNQIYYDPHSAIYISKLIRLDKPADSLKVIFDAYRHSTNDIRVAYRIIRENIPIEQQVYELFPGYNNLDNNKNVINPSKNDGLPDTLVPSSNTIDDYRNYEFTAKNLPQFSGYQIKIMISGTSQANVPLIKDFRAIATL